MAHNARSGGGGTVRPARWHHGGVTEAHQSSALQGYGAPFWWFLFLRNWWSARKSPRVSSTAGGSRAGRAVARFKLQPSAMMGECSMGRLMTRLGQMGEVWNVEHQCQVDGAQGASHVAWR
jgi:hypothetical protein